MKKFLRSYAVLKRLCVLIALCAVVGCGKSAPPATVAGCLKMNNQPLPHCLVKFVPESGKDAPKECACGATDDEGRYELRFLDQKVGVAAGKYVIILDDLDMLQPIDRGNAEAEPPPTAKRPPASKPRFNESYFSAAHSPLRCEVKTGSQVIDIELPNTVQRRDGS